MNGCDPGSTDQSGDGNKAHSFGASCEISELEVLICLRIDLSLTHNISAIQDLCKCVSPVESKQIVYCSNIRGFYKSGKCANLNL